MSMSMVLEVEVGGKRGYRVAHSPFREQHKIGKASDDHDRDAALQLLRKDGPRSGRTRVTVPDKDGGVALGPLYVLRCVDRGFDILAIEIHRVHLYLGKCATFSREVRPQKQFMLTRD
jgi:hypothetical protein